MSGTVAREADRVARPARGRAAEAFIGCVVRVTQFLCAIISAEPWYQTPRPASPATPANPAAPAKPAAQPKDRRLGRVFP